MPGGTGRVLDWDSKAAVAGVKVTVACTEFSKRYHGGGKHRSVIKYTDENGYYKVSSDELANCRFVDVRVSKEGMQSTGRYDLAYILFDHQSIPKVRYIISEENHRKEYLNRYINEGMAKVTQAGSAVDIPVKNYINAYTGFIEGLQFGETVEEEAKVLEVLCPEIIERYGLLNEERRKMAARYVNVVSYAKYIEPFCKGLSDRLCLSRPSVQAGKQPKPCVRFYERKKTTLSSSIHNQQRQRTLTHTQL